MNIYYSSWFVLWFISLWNSLFYLFVSCEIHSGGEDKDKFWPTVHLCTDHLPKNKPRYCMGVGFAVDLVVCCALGVDMFDCVFPTRTAVSCLFIFKFKPFQRHKTFWTSSKKKSQYFIFGLIFYFFHSYRKSSLLLFFILIGKTVVIWLKKKKKKRKKKAQTYLSIAVHKKLFFFPAENRLGVERVNNSCFNSSAVVICVPAREKNILYLEQSFYRG